MYRFVQPGSALNFGPQSCALVLMAKAPRVGLVKTRLKPQLTSEQAAALSRSFIQDMAHNIAGLFEDSRFAGVVAYTPSGEESAFDGLLPAEFFLIAQRGADLGERLRNVAEDLFTAGFSAVCLINSDSPTLPRSLFAEAAAALWSAGNGVVLGAASDGGYYLIGLKRFEPHLFARIDWSTSRVCSQTLERAAEAGLATLRLPEWYDVDDWDSLKTLYRELSMPDGLRSTGPQGYEAPATARYLRQLAGENPDLTQRLAQVTGELPAP